MSGDTQITIAGNLVDDPTLRFTRQGRPVASFRVASVPRYFDKTADEWRDGNGLYLTVNVWRQQAENVCASLQRGARVIVTGWLRQRNYETREGDKRTVYEVEADDVAASLKFARAKVTKVSRSRLAESRAEGRTEGRTEGSLRPDDDAWTADGPPGSSEEEALF